jgi:hypothetical protein
MTSLAERYRPLWTCGAAKRSKCSSNEMRVLSGMVNHLRMLEGQQRCAQPGVNLVGGMQLLGSFTLVLRCGSPETIRVRACGGLKSTFPRGRLKSAYPGTAD